MCLDNLSPYSKHRTIVSFG